ncbi:hypothetical protein GEV33_004143 [Tenebrio molitor]|uniref:Uncharacterized protein n=1 Tax=Tenebrio molitor TaxID=7067 RepID=A0A8J6LGL2_TENMO|nr:hypothetical protein GEV33_004143 [Tenebrio molitor]
MLRPNRTHVSGGNKPPPDPRYAGPMPEDRHCSSAFLISLLIFLNSLGVKRSAKDNLRHWAALHELEDFDLSELEQLHRSCRPSKLISPLLPCYLERYTRWAEDLGCRVSLSRCSTTLFLADSRSVRLVYAAESLCYGADGGIVQKSSELLLIR